MKKSLVSLAVLAFLVGCAVKQPIPAEVAARLKASTITKTLRAKPDFSAQTWGYSSLGFGVLGALGQTIMVNEGNKIIVANRIADPAEAIATKLSNTLGTAHEASVVSSRVVTSELLTSNLYPAATIVAGKNTAKFILDVSTTLWNFTYFPLSPTRYRVVYAATANLIEVDTQTVVAKGACMYFPDSPVGAPTYDELLAEGATRLKAELALAVANCTEKLAQDISVAGR